MDEHHQHKLHFQVFIVLTKPIGRGKDRIHSHLFIGGASESIALTTSSICVEVRVFVVFKTGNGAKDGKIVQSPFRFRLPHILNVLILGISVILFTNLDWYGVNYLLLAHWPSDSGHWQSLRFVDFPYKRSGGKMKVCHNFVNHFWTGTLICWLALVEIWEFHAEHYYDGFSCLWCRCLWFVSDCHLFMKATLTMAFITLV